MIYDAYVNHDERGIDMASRSTTHPNRRDRQRRALALAERRLFDWEHGLGDPDNCRNYSSDEDKAAKAELEVSHLLAKGVK